MFAGFVFETGAINAQRFCEPHIFVQADDDFSYEWLRQVGCYSPIIHLQQTNGLESAHKHFTPENNACGKIEGKAVLSAFKRSFNAPEEEGMPQHCREIYLTTVPSSMATT
jgi:hypothetical protein